MKKSRVLRFLGLALVVPVVGLFGIGPVAAEPNAPTWSSGFQVMNVDPSTSADATGPLVTVSYYDMDATSATPRATQTLNIPYGKSATIPSAANPMQVSAGFQGGVVIESTAKVAAITNVYTTEATKFMYGSYNGVNTPATSFSLPLVMRGNSGWNTAVYVQNAGTAAADVTITYTNSSTGATKTESKTALQPGAMHKFDQADPADPAGLGTKFVGSATVTSSQVLAAMVIESNGSQMLAYSGFGSGAATVYVPLLQFNNGGWTTGIQVQNTSGTTGTVALQVGGTTIWTSKSLAPGQSDNVYPLPAHPSGKKFDAGKLVGPAGSQLVAIVNQLGPSGQGTSYGGFTAGTNRVAAPLLMNKNSADQWATGFQVQNVSGKSITAHYYLNGTEVGTGKLLADGEAWNLFPVTDASGFVGAGEVSSADAGAQLVGVINEICSLCQANGKSGDFSMTYEGLNLQ